eukprot:3141381-Rhodomonas_salina.1
MFRAVLPKDTCPLPAASLPEQGVQYTWSASSDRGELTRKGGRTQILSSRLFALDVYEAVRGEGDLAVDAYKGLASDLEDGLQGTYKRDMEIDLAVDIEAVLAVDI